MSIFSTVIFSGTMKTKKKRFFSGEYFTVFAPMDEAFKKLPPAVMENKTRLAEIVKFHIVQVIVFF